MIKLPTLISDTIKQRNNAQFPVAYASDINASETDSRNILDLIGNASSPTTTTSLGVMKVGDGLDVEVSTDPDNPNPDAGLVSVHKATDEDLGGVIIGSGVSVDDGEISVPYYVEIGTSEPENKNMLWLDTSVSYNFGGDEFSIKNYNRYSTEEVICGCWIDGKPIYRRVIDTGNVSIDANSWSKTNIKVSDLNGDKLIHSTVLRFTESQNDYAIFNDIGVNFDANGYVCLLRATAMSNQKFTLVLEYTKTTD